MAKILNYVQNDTAPSITFNVTRAGTGAVDLTGSTVKFKILDPDSATETNTGHQSCTLTSPTTGVCTYSFTAGDIPNAKSYTCDLSITWVNSSIETIYDTIVLNVRASN